MRRRLHDILVGTISSFCYLDYDKIENGNGNILKRNNNPNIEQLTAEGHQLVSHAHQKKCNGTYTIYLYMHVGWAALQLSWTDTASPTYKSYGVILNYFIIYTHLKCIYNSFDSKC